MHILLPFLGLLLLNVLVSTFFNAVFHSGVEFSELFELFIFGLFFLQLSKEPLLSPLVGFDDVIGSLSGLVDFAHHFLFLLLKHRYSVF